jgi:hypothetical protein
MRREDGEIVQGGGEIVRLDKDAKKGSGRNGKKVEEESWRYGKMNGPVQLRRD